jgi:pimeloyl-ACP methyl ester carboxylesterase
MEAKNMSKRGQIILVSVAILVALTAIACERTLLSVMPTALPAATPTPTQVPARFEAADCMFDKSSISNQIDCGYLHVPEDRALANSPMIKLAVAIVRSTNLHPAPDPVIYLQGGPGVDALIYVESLVGSFSGILANRDLILFDQRGVGFSSPSLKCPETNDQFFEDIVQNLSREEVQQHGIQAIQACHDRLVQEGINLSAYTSAASAADVNDLRVALGYPEWNIYGGSYGTRLALTIMRDFPGGVRSVILDSVWPPQVDEDAEAASGVERALDLLFDRCTANPECNAAYPNLKAVFYDTVAQLDAKPISFMPIRNETQKVVKVLMNGDNMISVILSMLYSTDALPYLPKVIYELHEGHADRDAMLNAYWYAWTFSGDYGSAGMQLSVECGEEVSFSSAQAIATANATVFPRLRDALDQGTFFSVCPAWDVKPAAAIENQPVASNIPTLILAGDNDPATPPAWGKLAAQTLSNSHYFEFPWVAHGVIYGDNPAASCAQNMMNAFVADPNTAPDSTCINSLKVFFVTK